MMSAVVVPKPYGSDEIGPEAISYAAIGAQAPVASVGRSGLVAWLKRHRTNLTLLVTLVVLALVGGAIYRIGQNLRPAAVLDAVTATSSSAIALATLFTALSFASLVCYDLSGLGYVGRRLPWTKVAFTAFCAYAIGNVTGIGALSGGAIRLRYYGRAGLSAEEVAKVTGFVALAFGLGVGVLTALALLIVPDSLHALIGGGTAWLEAGSAAVLALAAVLIAAGRRLAPTHRFVAALPGRAIVLRQLAVTALDLATSATVLYVLLPAHAVSWPAFLAVFVVATGAGVISHVPAGLGVFETIVIAGLGAAVPLPATLSALVLYRALYQVAPLVLALALVGGTELAQHRLVRIVDAQGRLRMALAALLAATCGLVMILSGPGGAGWLSGLPAGWAAVLQVAPALLGGLLLLSARGLGQRLDGAWWVACCAGVLAPMITLALHGITPAVLLQAALLAALGAGRDLCTRPARLMSVAATRMAWLEATALVLALAVIVLLGRQAVGGELWWLYWLSDAAPDGLQALLGLAVLSATGALLLLLRPLAPAVAAASPTCLESALRIVEAEGSATANLVRMGDKSVLFSADRQAFIMYAKQGRSWIALFDPVGPRGAWADLVGEFIEAARAAGCRAVFYQVSPAVLPLSADAGLRAFKLGEQAVVDLTAFDLKGGKWASLRRSVNRAARDGLAFAVVEPEGVAALMDELKAVSDTWLAHHNTREKGFSIGTFDPAYVASHRVATLRLEGRLVAFATLLATGARQDVFIDLMRHLPGVHRGGMDMLFVEIITHLKRDGFRSLNLGMAPLAGLSGRASAPLWTKLARAMFQHGERLYNFKGLLAFKAKFDPEWQPRYLVVAGGINPYLAIMDVAILIGGGLKGVFRK